MRKEQVWVFVQFVLNNKNGKKKKVWQIKIRWLITQIFSQSGSGFYIALYISSGMKIIRYYKKKKGRKWVQNK